MGVLPDLAIGDAVWMPDAATGELIRFVKDAPMTV
jgi:hypothetical protein